MAMILVLTTIFSLGTVAAKNCELFVSVHVYLISKVWGTLEGLSRQTEYNFHYRLYYGKTFTCQSFDAIYRDISLFTSHLYITSLK